MSTRIDIGICNPKDFDPLNAQFNPDVKIMYEIDVNAMPHYNQIIRPFWQSYEYLVIGFDNVYNILKVIPYCSSSKHVFNEQIKN